MEVEQGRSGQPATSIAAAAAAAGYGGGCGSGGPSTMMAGTSGESEKASTRNVVIDFLLHEHYLLTAFELYHELLEDGHAAAAVKLHNFFTDAETFPPDQMQALADIDAQVLAKEREAASKRAALTEYELRLAREDIASLHEKLQSLREVQMATVKECLVSGSAELQEGVSIGNGDDGDGGTLKSQKRVYRDLQPLGDMERRDLNCAVKAFLVSAGYKLTAMTLYEEVDQDLDDWPNQVPDALRRYYLSFLSSTGDALEEMSALQAENAALVTCKELLEQELQSVTRSLEAARKDAKEKDRQFRQLKESLAQAERQLNEFRSEVTALKLELEHTNRDVEFQQPAEVLPVSGDVEEPQISAIFSNSPDSIDTEAEVEAEPNANAYANAEVTAEANAEVNEDVTSEVNAEANVDPGGTFWSPMSLLSSSSTAREDVISVSSPVNGYAAVPAGEAFRDMLRPEEHEDRRERDELQHKAEVHTVQIVAEALPKIVPYVLINYREELLPLIICAIERHPDDSVRDQLTHTLFNLIKRPDEQQRRVIMDACVTLARNVGEVRTETELLPQCWEQIDHKYEERRILVAQSCGELGQFVKADMRPSLILSIVQQLIEDEAHVVREAAAHNLALLLPLFPNLDKFSKVEEMMFALICDPARNVGEASLQELLPAMLDWSKHDKQLLSHLLGGLLSRLLGLVQSCPPVSSIQDSLEFQLRILGDRERWIADILLRTLIALFPEVRRVAAESCPFPDIFFEEEEDLVAFFSEELLKLYARSNLEWPEFDWLPEDCFPILLHVSTMLPSREEGLRTRLSHLIRTGAKLFGSTYLTSILLPIFLMASGDFADTSHLSIRLAKRIKGFKPLTPKAEQLARNCVLPLLLAGVFGAPNMTDGLLANYLRDLVLQSSLNKGSWTTVHTPELIDAVRFLCTFKEHLDVVIGVLWDLVVNPNASAKISAAVLFKGLVPCVDLKLATQQVLPALVTLGSDTNLNVRYASIDAFGAVAQQFIDDTVVDKIMVQMDAFLDDDGSHEATIAVVRSLAAAVPLASPSLRDYLMQKLVALSGATNQNCNLDQRREKVDAFCEAIRALDATNLSPSTVKDLLLPTIHNLLKDMDALDPAHKEALEVILRERGGLRLDLLSKHLRKTSMGGLFGEGGYLGTPSSTSSSLPPMPEASVPVSATAQVPAPGPAAAPAPAPAAAPAPAPAPPAESRLKFWRTLRSTSTDA